MSRLVKAEILPDTTLIGEVQVELTFEKPAIGLKDWKGLHAALRDGDIPMTRYTQVRAYASQELAEAAIAAMGGKVAA